LNSSINIKDEIFDIEKINPETMESKKINSEKIKKKKNNKEKKKKPIISDHCAIKFINIFCI
jgi:hypothetical protein